jgi:predicted GNAT family N-acyltransferase
MTTITIIKATWAKHAQQLSEIRYTVFVEEQQVPVELEMDEYDPHASHWLAQDGDQAIATVRMLTDGKIGRMAVLAPYRRRGIGKALLQSCIEEAKARHFDTLELGAQVHAIGFYQRQGFEPVGDRFIDAGIPHQTMRMTLAPVLPNAG